MSQGIDPVTPVQPAVPVVAPVVPPPLPAAPVVPPPAPVQNLHLSPTPPVAPTPVEPPVPTTPVEPVPTTPVEPAPAAIDYKAELETYASNAMGSLSEVDKALITDIAGDDPAAQLRLYTKLQTGGKLGASTPAQPAAPVAPTAPPVAPVSREPAGGEPKAQRPTTMQEAGRNFAMAVHGHNIKW